LNSLYAPSLLLSDESYPRIHKFIETEVNMGLTWKYLGEGESPPFKKDNS